MLEVIMRRINKEEMIVVSSLDIAETFTYYDEDTNRHYTSII